MVKVVVHLHTLMQSAKRCGQARLYGTPEDIEKAEAEHQEILDLFLSADEVHTGYTWGSLYTG